MFPILITISISIFFLLFFGFMMLGNRVAHTIDYIQAKEADEELAYINDMMSKEKKDEPARTNNKKKR